MRLGKLWIALAACLCLAGIASAQVPDPILVLGGDPLAPPIQIFNTQNFAFTINFGSCTSNCTVLDDFQNDTTHDLASVTFNFAGGGLTCQLGNGNNGAPLETFYNNCSVNGTSTSVTFFGLDATHGGIPSAVCVDTDNDGDGGANCNQDDTWEGGGFSLSFQGFTPNHNGNVNFSGSATTTPEPASFGLLFSGLGVAVAGWKRFASRRSA